MSQFNLTHEEDITVLSALRSKAASYLATYGVFDSELEALIDKVEGQLSPAVVETPPDLIEPTEAEIEAHFAEEEASRKAKKTKAE
jgi:hypothetical protein